MKTLKNQSTNKIQNIYILKNGQVIKTFTCKSSHFQRTWDHVLDIAGGLWNGVDQYTVFAN